MWTVQTLPLPFFSRTLSSHLFSYAPVLGPTLPSRIYVILCEYIGQICFHDIFTGSLPQLLSLFSIIRKGIYEMHKIVNYAHKMTSYI